MSLQNLMTLTSSRTLGIKEGLSEERLQGCLPQLRATIAFYREYPDIFIDHIKGEKSTFKFYFYQRVFLRIVMRHRYVFATFPRAFSKSFLSVMSLMLKCILFPGANLFVTTGGKQQAASITLSKVDQICRLLPCLSNQINWQRGKSKKSKDEVNYVFKNGSQLNILAARQSSRGQRRHGGLMEQCILIDGTILNEIVIPTTNVDRRLPDGSIDRPEVLNKSQVYITTAGTKDLFAYKKQMQLLIQSIIQPDEAMIIGGTYRIPILEGLLSESFIQNLKLADTYTEESFARQYESVWVGDAEGAFYSTQQFDKNRVLLQAEYEASGRSSKNAYYIFGVDVGRIHDSSEICVFKVTPQPMGSSLKSLVNIYTLEAEHFETQAIMIKKLYYKYKPRKVVIDANGLGHGLMDFMVIGQTDPESGDWMPPFGVDNDEDGLYKKMKTQDTLPDIIYQVKANASLDTDAFVYVQTQISTGKVRFLTDEIQAKTKLMDTKVGQNMTPSQRSDYLKPYVATSGLREQMANLVQENEGVNIKLKQSSRSVKKDRFSAFAYAMYYIEQEEKRLTKRKRFDVNDMVFFTNGK